VDKKREAQQHTLDGLGVDVRVIDVELIGEYDNVLWSRVWRSRVKPEGCGETVPYGDTIIRQSSTSPVAPEWTIDDDSKGSIARDRFNLVAYH